MTQLVLVHSGYVIITIIILYPFGMPPLLEIKKYINNIKYNDIQYQDIKSVLCGYYCLYFLKRLNDSYKIYDILYKDLDYKNPMKNESMVRHFFN